MRSLTIRKGERTRVLHLLSDHMRQRVRFAAEPVAGDDPISGKVEVVGSRWLFRKPAATHGLGANNSFDKGMWDSLYSIYVTPDQDTRITFQSRHVTARLLFFALGLVVLAAVASVVVMAILRGGQ